MKTLSEMLRPYVGKRVGVQILKGQQVLAIAGEVEDRDGETVFFRERSSQQGQPRVVMTPAGPQPMPGEDKILPRSVIHLGHITEEDVILLEETIETEEEAAAALGSAEAGKEPMIQTPPMNFVPR